MCSVAGSPITGYKIYRGFGENEPTLIAQVRGGTHSFVDRKAGVRQGAVYYQVTVLNEFGESPRTRRFYAEQPLSKAAE